LHFGGLWCIMSSISGDSCIMAKTSILIWILHSSWLVYLDESMPIWHSKWTCHGWIVCSQKSHLFVNEYHTAYWSQVVCLIVLVEGMIYNGNLGLNNTPSMVKHVPSYYKCRSHTLVLEVYCARRWFLSLTAITELRKHGLFGFALMNKHMFWSFDVPGGWMDAHHNNFKVGCPEAIQCTKNCVIYNLLIMKESHYVIKIMATAGDLVVNKFCCYTVRHWISNGADVLK
jgi:hypothetical protein